ncbi:MAG: hypothetical protein KY450_12480, partial [Actinobacteria bacterium]|nr:hypothetical protein [Actinomycetota bacterium]
AEGSVTVSACASADASTADPSISDLSVRDLPVRGLGGILGVVLGLVDTVVGILGHGGAGGGLLGS